MDEFIVSCQLLVFNLLVLGRLLDNQVSYKDNRLIGLDFKVNVHGLFSKLLGVTCKKRSKVEKPF